MRATLYDLSFTRDGRQRLTLELEGDFRESFDALRDNPVEVEVKRWRKKRSLSANGYFWVLCGKLSERIGIPPDEIYRQLIPDVGGNYEINLVPQDRLESWSQLWAYGHKGRLTEDMGERRDLPGYHEVKCYLGSSEYDTAQMSRLIDLVVAECREQGIETLTPEELARLEGYDAQYLTG